jgi:molybdate transport system substrate-binding protein
MRSLLMAIGVLMASQGGGSQAADIRVVSSNGVKAVLEELAPQFEKGTRNKLTFKFAPAAELKAQIEKGEIFDLAILTSAAVEDLAGQGRVSAVTRAAIARSGVGVAIRRGAHRPDIATPEAFKRTLLAAKSIAYVGTGATGANIRKIFDRFGIANEMNAKTRLLSGVSAADAVARGDAELGFTQISEILPVAGAELAGPLPAALQVYTVFTAAVGSRAREPQGAQAFIGFLTAPAAASAIKASGMEPGRGK